MAFENLSPKPEACCSMSVLTDQDCYKKITLRIGADVLSKLNWDKTARVGVRWGTGEDAGSILFCGDPAGYRFQKMGKSSSRYIVFGRFPNDAIVTDHPTEMVQHEITNDGLVIKLPDFIRFDG